MRYRLVLSAIIFLLSELSVSAQITQWQSMDGPYRIETRYHGRYADGERIFVGTISGTHRSLDGGSSWLPSSAPPALNLKVKQSSTGILYGVGELPIGTKPSDGLVKGLFRSTDRGAKLDRCRQRVQPGRRIRKRRHTLQNSWPIRYSERCHRGLKVN